MLSMYAKLFSRIAESSLMEQEVTVRYCFMMLLAVSDMHGDVIGTDVAIARRLNLPVEDFTKAIAILMMEDRDSNSQDENGKRVIPSESGRGYHIVNYVKYREIKTDEEKRAYMREYMRRRRKSPLANGVTDVKSGKVPLVRVTHAEAESETKADTEAVVPTELAGEDFAKAWAEWAEYRRQAKLKAYTQIGAKQQLSALSKLGKERAIAAINNSIANGYQGIFEPKPNGNSNRTTADRERDRTGLGGDNIPLKVL